MRLVTAESCTGGMIAAAMTDRSGSSAVFERGFVTYSNESKMEELGVQPSTIESFGAVSSQCAIEMAQGALRSSCADIAISVTGIAGPTGGLPEKPVGLVFIGIATRNKTPHAFKHIFDGNRTAVRQQSVETALKHLIDTFGMIA